MSMSKIYLKFLITDSRDNSKEDTIVIDDRFGVF
jgi:hypothetical protein